MISGKINGKPITYIGRCSNADYPHVVEYQSVLDKCVVDIYSDEGRNRSGLVMSDFVNTSGMEFDF